MSRLFDRLENDQFAVGTIMLTEGADFVEVLGYAGFDFCCIDMMVTSIDWGEAAHQIRAANRHNVTPWIRLQAYPFGHDTHPDGRLPADVLRALSIGAECVLASVNTAEAVAALIHPVTDSHRRPYIHTGGPHKSDLQDAYERRQPGALVFPNIETRRAVDNLAEILAVPDLRAVMLGLGDLSSDMGTPGDDRSPVMVELIQEVVRRASERNVMVFANVLSYLPDSDSAPAMASKLKWLWEAGVRAGWISRQPLVVQRVYEETLRLVRADLQEDYI